MHVGHTWRGSSGAPVNLASGRKERSHRAVTVPSAASSPRWVSSSRSEATNQVMGCAVSGARQDRGHRGLVPALPESMYGGDVCCGGGACGNCCAGAARCRRLWLWYRTPWLCGLSIPARAAAGSRRARRGRSPGATAGQGRSRVCPSWSRSRTWHLRVVLPIIGCADIAREPVRAGQGSVRRTVTMCG